MEYFSIIDCHPSVLLDWELADFERAHAWGINRQNGLEKIENRKQLLKKVYPDYLKKAEQLDLVTDLSLLWKMWLPMAIHLSEIRYTLNRPLIQGILGGQGTGKTTLCAMVSLILSHLGYQTLAISLDDFYKTYLERQNLLKVTPCLIWRGPPGTHDVELGIELLDRIQQKESPILVPRFDKSLHKGAGDRIEFESVSKVDIVLFEGWFVGVQPLNMSFDDPLTEVSNQSLYHYLPLWERLDLLMLLLPVDYRLSKQWRTEAEQKMDHQGKLGMNDKQVNLFVEYFWRSLPPELFINPLINHSSLINLVVEINANHKISKIYLNNLKELKNAAIDGEKECISDLGS